MVYLIWLSVAPLAGCRVVPQEFDPRLECSVSADSPESARELLEIALARDRYGIDAIEACVAYEAGSWGEAEDPGGAIRAAAAAAERSESPVFASFGRGPRPSTGSIRGR